VTRAQPLSDGERLLVETADAEITDALETARLLRQGNRRIEQQSALLHAAQALEAISISTPSSPASSKR
jgi:hypothetical protein